MRSFEFIRSLLVSCPELKDQSVLASFERDDGTVSRINYVELVDCDGQRVIMMGFRGLKKGLSVREVMKALKRLKAPNSPVVLGEFSREEKQFLALDVEGCHRAEGSLFITKL